MCFGTAAAGAGPAWNAGTGCAPGLLWKLAAGDGGGDSQRAPGGRSGSGGGAQSLAHSQAQDARSLSTRHEGHRWSRLQKGERSGGGSVGRGWRRCRVSRGSGGAGRLTGRRSRRLASGRAPTRPERTGLAPTRRAAAAECGAGSASLSLSGDFLAPPPRCTLFVEFRGLSLFLQGKSLRARGGYQSLCSTRGVQAGKVQGRPPLRPPGAVSISPAVHVIFRRDHS